MKDLLHNIEHYLSTDKREIFGLFVTIVCIAFMLSFRKWGGEEFDVAIGFSNLLGALFVTAVAVLAHVLAQKITAVKRGYIPKYKMFPYGLVGGVVLTFITQGFLFFMPVGGISIKHLANLRLGKFRYGLNFGDLSRISLSGPLMNIFLALAARLLSADPTGVLEMFIHVNLLLAVFSMFPIPPLNGINIIFQSRVLYVIATAFILAVAFLIQFANPFLALFGGIVLAVLVGIFYIFGVENK